MGFFFRRSIGFGPFRINLSKSGVGESVGFRGFRIGINPKGKKYVRAGAGGIYYYKTIPDQVNQTAPTAGTATASPPPQLIGQAPSLTTSSLQQSADKEWLNEANVRALESDPVEAASAARGRRGEARNSSLVIMLLGILGLVAAIVVAVLSVM